MMLSAIRLLLGPFLLLQGARVRRNILRLPEPSGNQTGQTGSGSHLSLLLLGDSSIAGVGAETQQNALSGKLSGVLGSSHSVSWTVHAKTGWTTADALDALTEITPSQTDVVVIALGVNDVTTETGIATWLKTYSELLERVKTDFKPKIVVISDLPEMGTFPALPHPLRWYLGKQAKAHGLALAQHFSEESLVCILPLRFDLDSSAMAEDGFHPGPKVYEEWAGKLASVIQNRMAKTPAG